MDDYISDTASTQNLFGKPQHTMFFQFFHIVSDIAPYWTQVVLTLAMAIKRYILICRATRSGNIISKRNRKLVYCGLMAAIFGICGGILFQHGYRVVKEVKISSSELYSLYRALFPRRRNMDAFLLRSFKTLKNTLKGISYHLQTN